MKKFLYGTLLTAALAALSVTAWSLRPAGAATAAPSHGLTDATRVEMLLDEMKVADLDKLDALPVEPFKIPGASVDVMRVRLEETYEVAGIGRDTVELHGWIAAKIDNARPARGETEVRWGTAISDTEFVGMELRGESAKFGPVIVRINHEQPSKGQVGALEFSMPEAIALGNAYKLYREPGRYGKYAADPEAEAEPDPVEPQRQTADQKAIAQVMSDLWASLERKDPAGFTKDFSTDFDYPGSARPGVDIANKAEYIADLRDQLSNVRSMKVNARAPTIRVTGNFARVTARGTNTVVPREGEGGDTKWTASVFFQKVRNRWRITQNQIRFNVADDDSDNLTKQEIKRRASSCRASLSIDVQMPKLDLWMKSEHPVVWYSEVETIPPVGYTASVSLTPTPMLSNGRRVATLEHGAVKFREIVRHVALDGSRGTQLSSR
jgi:hypothetical protein